MTDEKKKKLTPEPTRTPSARWIKWREEVSKIIFAVAVDRSDASHLANAHTDRIEGMALAHEDALREINASLAVVRIMLGDEHADVDDKLAETQKAVLAGLR